MIESRKLLAFLRAWLRLKAQRGVVVNDVFEDNDGVGFSILIDDRFLIELKDNGTWSITDKKLE